MSGRASTLNEHRYYEGLQEIEEVETAERANERLLQGWELIRPVELNGGAESATKIHYLMGRFKAPIKAPIMLPFTTALASVTATQLESLHWQQAKNSNVEFVPLSELPPNLKTVSGAFGNYTYWQSTTGNLSRRKISK